MSLLIDILRGELDKRRRKNPRYTVGALARDAGLDPSTLHQILKGERRVSLEKMHGILDRLGVEPTQRQALIQLTLTGEAPPVDELATFEVRTELPEELSASWLCYATMSAFELADRRSETSWFAARLGVEPERMERVLAQLEAASLIDRRQPPWQAHPVRLSSGRGRAATQAALLKAHAEYIDLARRFVTEPELAATLGSAKSDLAEATADVSGMTLSIDRRRLPEALRMIREFRRSLAEFLGGGPEAVQNDEVYRLNVQLFPVSQREEGLALDGPRRENE